MGEPRGLGRMVKKFPNATDNKQQRREDMDSDEYR
jgi:hypothetical protein